MFEKTCILMFKILIRISHHKVFFVFSEPTDTGIIPPQFRKAHQVSPQQQNINAASNHQPETNGDKKQPHQWSSSPVEEWAKEQVRNLFFALNL